MRGEGGRGPENWAEFKWLFLFSSAKHLLVIDLASIGNSRTPWGIGVYLHFSQECINVGDCGVEDVRWEIVPDLETPEDVWGAVSHARGNSSAGSRRETSSHLLPCQQGVQLMKQWVDLHNYLGRDHCEHSDSTSQMNGCWPNRFHIWRHFHFKHGSSGLNFSLTGWTSYRRNFTLISNFSFQWIY